MKIVQLMLSIKNNNRASQYVIISFSVGSRKILFKLILRIKISIHANSYSCEREKFLKNIYRNIE